MGSVGMRAPVNGCAAMPHVPESAPLPRSASGATSSGYMPLTLDQLDALLGAIYQGCLEKLPWSSALTALRDILDANWVTLILRPASDTLNALIVNAGPDGPFMEKGKFATHTAFMLDPFSGLPPDKIATVDEIVGAKEWLSSEFYRQFVEPFDIRYMIGADMVTADGSECRLRICRPHASSHFSESDKSICQRLLPHIKRAIELHSRLDRIESERTMYATTIDRMLLGTVVFDETGAIMRVNRAAEEILRQNDGLSIVGGRLEASYAPENRQLQNLIRRALADNASSASGIGQAISIARPSARAKLGIAVRANPLSEWAEGRHRPAVTVFIRDPEQKSMASRDVIQQLFELTPAEASLALLLADGMTLDEAADQLDIRKNTARAHLRSIFAKTGVTRQTSLVRLLLGSVTPLD
nr:LuxR C-terminal-related transcriptional regulator [Pandoraea vervacti]